MAYVDKYRITFPITYVNDTDYIQLVIDIENTNLTGATGINAVDQGIFINKYGSLKMSFELDDPLIVPGSLDMVIADPNEWMASQLFDHADEAYISARMDIILNVNGTTHFTGLTAEESVIWDAERKTLSFSAISDVDKLNKQMLFDEDNAVEFNPHGYTFAGGATVWPEIDTFILDIWQDVSPTATLNTFHEWLIHNNEPTNNLLFAGYHRINSAIFYQYAERATLGLRNTGDILRHLCMVFGCYTGYNKAGDVFFRQLFRYDSGHTQTLGEVLEYRKQFQAIELDYVRFISHESAIDDYAYQEGTLEDSGADVKKLDLDKQFHGFGDSYNSMVWMPSSFYTCDYCVDSQIDSTQRASLEQAAKFWYYNRQRGARQRGDYFRVRGIDYEFTKNFTYDSRNYQIISLEKHFETNYSEIIAMKVT